MAFPRNQCFRIIDGLSARGTDILGWHLARATRGLGHSVQGWESAVSYSTRWVVLAVDRRVLRARNHGREKLGRIESARKCSSNEFVMNSGFPQLFGYVTSALTFILLSLFQSLK